MNYETMSGEFPGIGEYAGEYTGEYAGETGESGEAGEYSGEYTGESWETYPEFGFESPQFSEVGSRSPGSRAGAQAGPQARKFAAQVQRHRQAYAQLMKATEAMKKHIALRNGALHLTVRARSAAEAAARLGIRPGLFSHLHRALKMRNAQAGRTGLTKLQSGPSRAVVSSEIQMEATSACAGVTKVETVWWGIKLWLDECKLQGMLSTLNVGAPLGGSFCAALGLAGPEAAAICGVILGLGAAEGALIVEVDKSGGSQGVVLSWTWAQILPGVPVIPVVTSQSSS